VLNNLALVIEPKDINPCPVAIARPLLVPLQHNDVIIGQGSPEFEADLLAFRRSASVARTGNAGA